MEVRNLLVNLGLVVGNAAAKYDPSGIASQLLDRYSKLREKEQLRSEFEGLLQLGFAPFREELADAMGDLRLSLAESVRKQVEAYLLQCHTSAKQASRILGDPLAATVPGTVSLDDPRELAAFLPQRQPRFTVGDTVPGLPSWVLTEPLGFGGFGEVWKAQNPYSGVAAFKFFLDPEARRRFTLTEATTLAEIHKNAPPSGVVKLLAAEPEQEPPWIQLEYAEGGDLSRLPDAWKGLTAANRVIRVQGVIRSLSVTVGHFHKLGVVHRDLKPANILLRKTASNKYQPIVADFGISKIVPTTLSTGPTPTNSGTAAIRAYTALYASPQQKKFRPADRRDDVYALGVLWYQLLRGDLSLERPSGDGWKQTLSKMGVNDAMIAILNRCWDDEAEVRPADGNELAQLLAVRADATSEAQVRNTSAGDESRAPSAAKDGQGEVSPQSDSGKEVGVGREASGREVKVGSRPKDTVKMNRRVALGLTAGVSGLWGVYHFWPADHGKPPQPEPKTTEVERNPQKPPAKYVQRVTPKPGDVAEFPLPGGLKMAFCWIPPGTAQLGSSLVEQNAVAAQYGKREDWLLAEMLAESEAKRGAHSSKGFWLGKYPVTQGEWQAVMGNNPSWFQAGGSGANKVQNQDTSRFPVERVSWTDCQPFLEKLNLVGGAEIIFGKVGSFALPHEDAWEYACRGGLGNQRAFYWGNELNGTQANINGSHPFGTKTQGPFLERPTPVGSYAANFPHPWGLCDMHGNVWEWCSNLHEQTTSRAIRGASWDNYGNDARAAARVRWEPGRRNLNSGLRVVLPLD